MTNEKLNNVLNFKMRKIEEAEERIERIKYSQPYLIDAFNLSFVVFLSSWILSYAYLNRTNKLPQLLQNKSVKFLGSFGIGFLVFTLSNSLTTRSLSKPIRE